MKKPNDFTRMQAEDACVCMHAALRKVCYSKITSAAYNLIHLISDAKPKELNPWIALGQLVADNINENRKPVVVCVKDAINKLDRVMSTRICDSRDKMDGFLPENTWSMLHALTCILDCFSEDDLARLAAYLEDK